MQFLSPLFWIGALAIAGPIILHLIRREKSDRIPFASLMFLRKIPKKEVQRQRLRYLFLLFLRCLALFLLVAAFARPVMKQTWATQVNPMAARSVLILIDQSLSMSSPSVWNKAVAAAHEKIRSLDDSDEGMIVAFGETAEVLSQWEKSRDRLAQILQSGVSAGFESTSYLEALRISVEQFKRAANQKKQMYLITDLQRAGLSGRAGWKVPAEINLEVEDVGAESQNVFIEEVRLEREIYGSRYPHPILVRVASVPARESRGDAQLYLEGKLVDRQSFQLGANGSGHLTFKPFDLDEGIFRGKIVIEPADSLPADNTFVFVVQRLKPRSVAVVTGGDRASSFYLENALTSGDNLPFQVQVIPTAGWGSLNPMSTPVVVANDVARPPSASAVASYVRQGGGVIVALAGNTRTAAYGAEWQDLLPVDLVDRNFVRSEKTPFTSITEASWDHPVFTIFRDVHKAAITSAQFYSYWKATPKAGAVVLARFSEGDPVVVERTLDKGKIIAFTSSLDTIWNDFALRAAYVPFWNRLVQYAIGWQPNPAAMKISQVLPVAESASRGNVIDPSGRRVLTLDQEKPGFITLKMPGHYEIRSQKNTDWVAVNPQSVESDLSRISEEEFLAAFASRQPKAEVLMPQDSVHEQERRQSLWWLFLAAAGLILASESLVANGLYGRRSIDQVRSKK